MVPFEGGAGLAAAPVAGVARWRSTNDMVSDDPAVVRPNRKTDQTWRPSSTSCFSGRGEK